MLTYRPFTLNTNYENSETQHPSPSDRYTHFTILYQDKDGNHITTRHVYPKKS